MPGSVARKPSSFHRNLSIPGQLIISCITSSGVLKVVLLVMVWSCASGKLIVTKTTPATWYSLPNNQTKSYPQTDGFHLPLLLNVRTAIKTSHSQVASPLSSTKNQCIVLHREAPIHDVVRGGHGVQTGGFLANILQLLAQPLGLGGKPRGLQATTGKITPVRPTLEQKSCFSQWRIWRMYIPIVSVLNEFVSEHWDLVGVKKTSKTVFWDYITQCGFKTKLGLWFNMRKIVDIYFIQRKTVDLPAGNFGDGFQCAATLGIQPALWLIEISNANIRQLQQKTCHIGGLLVNGGHPHVGSKKRHSLDRTLVFILAVFNWPCFKRPKKTASWGCQLEKNWRLVLALDAHMRLHKQRCGLPSQVGQLQEEVVGVLARDPGLASRERSEFWSFSKGPQIFQNYVICPCQNQMPGPEKISKIAEGVPTVERNNFLNFQTHLKSKNRNSSSDLQLY